MEGDFPPERLLTSVRRLKEVFDACDSDSVGFIRPEHFEQLGSQFGHADQVRSVSNFHLIVFVCLCWLSFFLRHKSATKLHSEAIFWNVSNVPHEKL